MQLYSITKWPNHRGSSFIWNVQKLSSKEDIPEFGQASLLNANSTCCWLIDAYDVLIDEGLDLTMPYEVHIQHEDGEFIVVTDDTDWITVTFQFDN